jgi:hypothetical protein
MLIVVISCLKNDSHSNSIDCCYVCPHVLNVPCKKECVCNRDAKYCLNTYVCMQVDKKTKTFFTVLRLNRFAVLTHFNFGQVFFFVGLICSKPNHRK